LPAPRAQLPADVLQVVASVAAVALCVACAAATVDQPGGRAGQGGAAGVIRPIAPPPIAPDAAASETPASCARETHRAEQVPLDLLLLVDVSSSMANPIAGGSESKWQVAEATLRAFLGDPATASPGLSIGLQFFPLGDYGKVNVTVEQPAGNGAATMATTVAYVGSATKCDAARGGWYYDRDPASGAEPSRVVMCDSTCQSFKAEATKVDLVFGCKTFTVD
jgi:hypothetical protein